MKNSSASVLVASTSNFSPILTTTTSPSSDAMYSLPFAPDYQLEGYISPDEFAFVSTQLPAAGSPLSVIGLPPFIKL